MSDLTEQVQQTVETTRALSERVAACIQRTRSTQLECEHFQLKTEEQYKPLRNIAQACRETLDSRFRAVDQESQISLEGLQKLQAWAEEAEQQAVILYRRAQEQVTNGLEQLKRLQARLETQKRYSTDHLEQDIARTLDQVNLLTQEITVTQTWIREQLAPMLQQRQARVQQDSERLREQILNRLLPRLAAEYQTTRRHLLVIAESLHESSQGNARNGLEEGLASLEELGKALEGLCSRSAAEARSTLESLGAEIAPIRSRVDELGKQGKIFQELGTPASTHLKVLVNVVCHLEDLLVQAKVMAASR